MRTRLNSSVSVKTKPELRQRDGGIIRRQARARLIQTPAPGENGPPCCAASTRVTRRRRDALAQRAARIRQGRIAEKVIQGFCRGDRRADSDEFLRPKSCDSPRGPSTEIAAPASPCSARQSSMSCPRRERLTDHNGPSDRSPGPAMPAPPRRSRPGPAGRMTISAAPRFGSLGRCVSPRSMRRKIVRSLSKRSSMISPVAVPARPPRPSTCAEREHVRRDVVVRCCGRAGDRLVHSLSR